MKFSRRRAISPIIATLLLIAIAVAAGIIVYVFVNSLAGGLTQGGGQQVASQIQMQAANFLPQTFGAGKTSNGQVLDIFLENTGSSSVSISSVYFDGTALTEWAYSSGTSYGTNLYVPHSGQSCFAMISSSISLTYSQTPTTLVSGTSTNCTTYTAASAVCNTVAASDFCITSSTATPPETGMTAVPLTAQGTAQLVIGLNFGAAVTSGSTHTIKLVTTSGTVAVFSVVAGRTG